MSNDAMLKRAKEVVVDFYVGREMEYDITTTGQKLVSIALGLWSNPMVCKWLVQPLSSIARSLSETPME